MFVAVPAGSANGTVLGTAPSNVRGVRFYLPASASITYATAIAAPSAPPSPTFTTPLLMTAASIFDDFLAVGENIYITAISGTPLYRWVSAGAPGTAG